jgi:hypothetical protein
VLSRSAYALPRQLPARFPAKEARRFEPHATFAARRRRTSPLGAAAIRFQGGLKTLDKTFSFEGLGQVANRAGSERLRTNLLIGEGREKNERHLGPLAAQASLQLDAAHAGHLDVSNYA